MTLKHKEKIGIFVLPATEYLIQTRKNLRIRQKLFFALGPVSCESKAVDPLPAVDDAFSIFDPTESVFSWPFDFSQ